MYIHIFDDMRQCTVDEVDRLSLQVSTQRKAQALRYKHIFGQYVTLKSYCILQHLLVAISNNGNNTSLPMPIFSYNEYGKPFIEGGPYFSISHCRKAIAVAVDTEPIGIDIESIRHAEDDLVRRTMNKEEQQRIHQSITPDEIFTALWTQKEAVLKMRGTGIIDDLREVLTLTNSPNSSTMVSTLPQLQTITVATKGYIYTTATIPR